MKFKLSISKNSGVKSFNRLILLMSAVLFVACGKEGDYTGSGPAILNVSLKGVDFGEEQSPLTKLASNKAVGSDAAQRTSVSFDEDYNIVAQLIPESSTPKPVKIASAVKGSGIGPMATVSKEKALTTNTKYRVVVYDKDGKYVDDIVYSAGVQSSEGFALDAGETYTFISFSTGSSTVVPAIDTTKTLSSAVLSGVSGNGHFMWDSKTLTLTAGVNNLDIVLKHRFSQITTVINASAIPDINTTTGIANVTAISATINPHRTSVNIKLSDGGLTYTGSVSSKSVSFPTLGASTIESAPTFVSSNTTTGTYTISTMKIGPTTKTNIALGNLKITPGVRYRLVLTFEPKVVDYGGSAWAPGNLIYNRTTQKYGFASTTDAYGDFFFYNYLIPKNLNGSNQYSSSALNGGPGDPCTKVLPLNTWRLPTEAQYNAIIAATDILEPPNYVPKRWVDHYNGSATNRGMFFDIRVSPGIRYPEFLFFSYGGVYFTGNSVTSRGTMGYYLLVGNKMLQLGDVNTKNIVSMTPNDAVQIRCVKNMP